MELHRVRALQARQSDIRQRWEALLRDEPPSSALANPDILVRLFDTTLGELFAALQFQARSLRPAPDGAYAEVRAGCACGRNPLVAYFLTGERALLETQAQLDRADSTRPATAMAELHVMIRQIARREVETFCGLCRQHGPENTRSVPPPRQGRAHLAHPRRPMTAGCGG